MAESQMGCRLHWHLDISYSRKDVHWISVSLDKTICLQTVTERKPPANLETSIYAECCMFEADPYITNVLTISEL